MAAEPRYVALCSTDGAECATAALTADGLPSESPETAVVSLSSIDEVSLVNRNAVGQTVVSVVGYFKGGTGADLGKYTAAPEGDEVTLSLGTNETRHISLPHTPKGARAVLVQIHGQHRSAWAKKHGTASSSASAEAGAAASTAPAPATSEAASGATGTETSAPSTSTPSSAPTVDAGDATVSVSTGANGLTADQVKEAIRNHQRATSSPSAKPGDLDGIADQVTEANKPATGTANGDSGSTAATQTPTPTPSATATQAPAPQPTKTATQAPAPQPTKSVAAPAPAAPPASSPAPSNNSGGTGVPAGVQLKVVNGDQTITTPGTVLDGLDIHGRVIVKAENVTIRNSIVRGTDAGGKYGLVDAMSGKAGLKITDTEIVATNPNYTVNGIMGSNFELTRVNIHNTVDQVHIAGGNVVVRDSWLHGTKHYVDDPTHSDGSHDDNIQIVAGDNILITGNVMQDAVNKAIMINQDSGATSNVTITGNKMDNGQCIVQVTSQGTVRGLVVKNNTFGLNGTIKNCAVYSPVSPVSMSGNTWTNGSAATLRTS